MSAEQQPIRFTSQYKLIAAAIVVALTIWFLLAVRHILAPFIAAIITAYIFNPVVTRLDRLSRVGRGPWIVVLYVIAFLTLYGLGTWISPQIVQQSRDLAAAAPDAATRVQAFFQGREQIELGGVVLDLAPIEEQLIGAISDLGTRFSESVPHLVFSALETVIFTLVYLIITFYLLLQGGQLRRWVASLIPPPNREEIGALGIQIDGVFGAYIRGQLLLIVLMSVALYIPLSILQMPNALAIAVTSGFLETIPIVGPWSAAAIAVTTALFHPSPPFGLNHFALAALIGTIYLVFRLIEEHFVLPNVMGPLVALHPGVVIFALLAGGALLGPFGLFISIPVAAVVRILLGFVYRKLTDQPVPPPPIPPEAPAPATAPRAEVRGATD